MNATLPSFANLTEEEAADYLGIGGTKLCELRNNGQSPPYSKVGRAYYYDTKSLDDFAAAGVITRRKAGPGTRSRINREALAKYAACRVSRLSVPESAANAPTIRPFEVVAVLVPSRGLGLFRRLTSAFRTLAI